MLSTTTTRTLTLPSLSTTLKTLALLLTLYITSRLLKSFFLKFRHHRTARSLSCLPPARFRVYDRLFGIDLLFAFEKAMKSHTALSYTRHELDFLCVDTASMPLLTAQILMTRDAENLKAMLASNFEDYGIEPIRQVMVPFLGRGIFVTDGPAWKHSRDVLRPVFTRTRVADLSVLRDHVTRFLGRVGALDGREVDLQPLFFDLTTDVATHVLFGRALGVQESGEGGVGRGVMTAYDGCLNYFMTGGEWEMLGISWFRKGRDKFKKDCAVVNDYVREIVEDAAARLKKGGGDEEKASSGGEVKDDRYILLEYLIEQNIPHDQVRAEALNTLLAGRDTTASMLSDLWFELSKHPRVFSKLHSEIREHVADENSLHYDQIKNLPYLKATLNEILRIHPVVPENTRVALRDTVLPRGGGKDQASPIFVPKGTLVSWSVYSMHRREDIWGADADEFRPERWLDGLDERGDEVKGVRPGWAYLPFNGGPRVCVGQQFALMQASYVTIRLMLSLERLESRDDQPWMEKLQLTTCGFNGCKVALFGKEG